MNNRIEYYDIAKGIAICLVVIGHISSNSTLNSVIYSFHIPIFFMISGSLIYNSNNKNKSLYEYMIIKNNSLLLPYALFSILYILINCFYNILNGSLNYKFILEDIYRTLTLEGINVLWFFPVLFSTSILLKIIIKIKKDSLKIIVTVLLYTLGLAMLLMVKNLNIRFIYICPISFVIKTLIVFPFVIIGYIFLKERNNKRTLYKSVISISFIIVTIIISTMYNQIDINALKIGNPIRFVLLGTLGSVGVIGVCQVLSNLRKIKNLLNIFSYWGKLSLLIMVTHNLSFIKVLCYKIYKLLGFNNFIIEVLIFMIFESIIITMINPFYKKMIKKLIKNRIV